jgi:hypothetical protein
MNGILNIHESIFSRRFQMLNSTVFVEEPFYGTFGNVVVGMTGSISLSMFWGHVSTFNILSLP